jgi:hypothetical protein
LEERGLERGDEVSQRETAERAGALADTPPAGQPGPAHWRERGGLASAQPSRAVADASGGGRGPQLGDLREGESDAGRRRDISDAWSDGGTPEPRLGGIAHGLPARVDRWPACPTEEQHPWEAPRVVTGRTVNRPARLRALGNAVVPQCAEIAGNVIVGLVRLERL